MRTTVALGLLEESASASGQSGVVTSHRHDVPE
jgi:hypothetical protein